MTPEERKDEELARTITDELHCDWFDLHGGIEIIAQALRQVRNKALSELEKRIAKDSQIWESGRVAELEEEVKRLREALDNANVCIKAGIYLGWKTIEWDKCIKFSEEALIYKKPRRGQPRRS